MPTMFRYTIRCLLLPAIVLACAFTGLVAAQQLPVTIYNEKNGISYVKTVCAFQDSKGWIWISTGNAIYRYEGSCFRYYPPPPGYSYKYVYAFAELDGELWCFDNEERVFVIHDRQVRAGATGVPAAFKSVVQVKPGEYIYQDLQDLYVYGDHHFTSLQKRQPGVLVSDDTDVPMLQLQDSLLLYIQPNSIPAILNLHDHTQFSLDKKITASGRDRTGKPWIITRDNELLRIDRVSWAQRKIMYAATPVAYSHLPGYRYYAFCWDISNNLWLLADNKGLVKIDTTGRLNIYSEQDGFSGITNMGMMQDRENNLWITADGFLAKISLSDPHTQYALKEGLAANLVWEINTTDQDSLVWAYSLKSQLFNDGRWQGLSFPAKDDSIGRIRQLGDAYYSFNATRIWKLQLNKQKSKVSGMKKILDLHNYFSPSRYGITGLMGLGKDSLLVSSILGLHVYVHGRFYKIPGFKKGETEHIHVLYRDRTGAIWAGLFGRGLFRFQLKSVHDSLRADHLVYWEKALAGIPALAWCRSICEDDDGNIWIGTRYDGLFRLRREAKGDMADIAHFGIAEGLSDNTVWDIKKDRSGHLWLATPAGLDRVIADGKTGWKMEQLGNSLGIKNSKTIAIDSRNRLWVDQFPGVASIDLNKAFVQPDSSFEVAITRCEIKGRPDTIAAAPGYTRYLQPDENDLSFELGANTYTNESYTRYSYLLGGPDKNWSPFARNYRINFSNLKPGKYMLRVRAMNKDGKLSRNTVGYAFVILPPLYLRWWFIALLAAVVVLLVYAAYYYRLNQIRRQVSFKLNLAESEMKALRAQMNPHFIFNCMTAIDAFIIKNDRKNASQFLNKFARLVRLVLENSQHPLIDLDSELRSLELYIQLEQIRFDKKFIYTITVDEKLKQRPVKLPPLLFQSYIENAILHGLRYKTNGDGLLEFSLTAKGDLVRGVIRDNGVGRLAAAEINARHEDRHVSMGMKIAAERLHLLKQAGNFDAHVLISDLYNDAGEPAGTEVVIELTGVYTELK